MENSFHGRTMAALSATGGEKAHAGFYPLLDGLLRVPYNDVDAIKKLSEKHNDIVAILLEPIQGEGGIIIPDENYLSELRNICNKFKLIIETNNFSLRLQNSSLFRIRSVYRCLKKEN